MEQTIQTAQPKVYEEIIKYALILGVAFFILGLLTLYLIIGSSSFLVSTIGYPLIFQLLIPLGLVIFMCIKLRAQLGGYWSFKQALKSIFLMFFVAWLFSFVLNVAYTKIIDKNVTVDAQVHMKENFSVYMKNNGMDDEKIDAEVAKLDKQFESQNQLTAKTVFRNITIAIPIIFVIALIFAALFKKEKPLSLTSFPEPDNA